MPLLRSLKGLMQLAAMLLLLVAVAGTLPAKAQTQADDDLIADFHEELSDYGRWIVHPRWGYVWSPDNVDDDWRPYSRGHWIDTEDHGWFWVSSEREPWGWATYHYGRWTFDDRRGWIWVPGTQWGPAWVAWREADDDVVGWAPLPPEAQWRDRDGLYFDSVRYYDHPRHSTLWTFVALSYLARPDLYRYAHPRHRNVYYFGRSRDVTSYAFDNRRVYNRGLNRRAVARSLGRPLVKVRIAPANGRRDVGFRGGNRSTFYSYQPRRGGAPSSGRFNTRRDTSLPAALPRGGAAAPGTRFVEPPRDRGSARRDWQRRDGDGERRRRDPADAAPASKAPPARSAARPAIEPAQRAPRASAARPRDRNARPDRSGRRDRAAQRNARKAGAAPKAKGNGNARRNNRAKAADSISQQQQQK